MQAVLTDTNVGFLPCGEWRGCTVTEFYIFRKKVVDKQVHLIVY